jgi:AAA family ATP:ADP antiporter
MSSRVGAAFEMRPGEGRAVVWAALTFFAVLTSYFVLKPVRDALVLDGDADFIPWLFTATFAAMVAIAGPWGALVARKPRGALVPVVYRAFAAQLLIFAVLFGADVAPIRVGQVFYVWLSVMNLFVVSVFWSLCADLTRPEQGRRLFGPIAAGGTAGALVGPTITRLAHDVEPAALLVLAAVLLELAVWTARGFLASAPATTATPAAPTERGLGGSPWTGLVRVVRSRELAAIAGYALCAACLATFVYLRVGNIVRAELPDRAERTAFYAEVEIWTGLATLALQLTSTARLLRWLGAGVVLAILPLVQSTGVIVLVLAPSLTVAIAVSATGRAATHALSRPSRELLFTALPRDDRYRAKNVIDTLVYRFGDVGSAWLHRGLMAIAVPIAAVTVPLAAAWTALALVLGRGHRRRIAAAEEAAESTIDGKLPP